MFYFYEAIGHLTVDDSLQADDKIVKERIQRVMAVQNVKWEKILNQAKKVRYEWITSGFTNDKVNFKILVNLYFYLLLFKKHLYLLLSLSFFSGEEGGFEHGDKIDLFI